MTTSEEQEHALRVALDAYEDLGRTHPEVAREFLIRMLEAIKDTQKKVTRDLGFAALLAIFFELLNRNLVGEASALGIKLSKIAGAKYVVPIVIAFLLFRAIEYIVERNIVASAYDAYCAAAFPQLSKSRAARIVAPFPYAVTFGPPPKEFSTSASSRYRGVVSVIEVAILVLVTPVGFIGYAIIQLFQQSDRPFVAASLAGAISASLLAAAYANFFIGAYNFDVVDKAIEERQKASKSNDRERRLLR